VSQLWELLPHMIKEPVWSEHFFIPINIYPDREKTSWQASRWTIEPKLPFIKTKFAILTSPSDQSSYETALGFVNYYKLGNLVGDSTAGCNGNVNYLPLIGKYSIRWSGMKVLKHDGSQHHLIGFYPDFPVVRTKEAVLQGKDEYLDKAKEILKEK
jgi:C-terminal processing protease CtpA/Prc